MSQTPSLADESLQLVKTIDVGGNGLGVFDISFVDPSLGLYVLADRTNASIDFVDTTNNTFLGRIGGFVGVVHNPDGTANNSLSGPDGVLIADRRVVWAGDGDSTVKVIDLVAGKITDTISTGGKFRVDEMAYDPRDHIIAVANNADTPPFITMIDTDSHVILGKITMDGTNNTPDAQGGIEQSQWSPRTGLFYLSVPQLGDNPALGGLAVIDPRTLSVQKVFEVPNCTPGGLALGPRRQALIGCSASFGTAPNVLTQSVIISITDGTIEANIPEVGGSDEVWYDRGTHHYYLAARNNTDNTGKITPVLGSIDARTNTFDGSAPTSTTAHSVAADSRLRRIFVPIGFVPPGSPPGTDPTNPCPDRGCIAVFVPSGNDDSNSSQQASR
ncbi:MAG: hypothetical protein JOZ42_02385 [Acetobacteraceae bacterium]|nr:hypothetical protein [Acetobacteraceae bacterium]